MRLPAGFPDRVRPLFPEDGAEFSAFLASFDEPSAQGLRANPARIGRDALRALLPRLGEPEALGDVPWCPDGLLLGSGAAPGRHPLHEAGLYYVQEPSAMLPAEVLAPQPGERVLDLCAAPGGKSVQIAAKMGGEGFLLANDLHEDRARALARNLERCGATNAAVTAASPERLADRLPGFFDRILVDAPCSGEGMLRRDPASAGRWASYADGRCRREQDAILDAADALLAPGGRLVYSTCTFEREEDEDAVAAFLDRHPEYLLEPVAKAPGVSDALDLPPGRGLTAAARIWPHRAPGDGHFCACLEKPGERPDPAARRHASASGGLMPASLVAFTRFAEETLEDAAAERFAAWIAGARFARLDGDHVHVLPTTPPDLSGLRVLKRGFHLGALEEGRGGLRFAPSHSLALVLAPGEARRSVDLPVEDGTALRYLKGETLSVPGSGLSDAGGWAAATVLGYPIGWLRPMGNGMFKNLHPPGWRRT